MAVMEVWVTAQLQAAVELVVLQALRQPLDPAQLVQMESMAPGTAVSALEEAAEQEAWASMAAEEPRVMLVLQVDEDHLILVIPQSMVPAMQQALIPAVAHLMSCRVAPVELKLLQ